MSYTLYCTKEALRKYQELQEKYESEVDELNIIWKKSFGEFNIHSKKILTDLLIKIGTEELDELDNYRPGLLENLNHTLEEVDYVHGDTKRALDKLVKTIEEMDRYKQDPTDPTDTTDPTDNQYQLNKHQNKAMTILTDLTTSNN